MTKHAPQTGTETYFFNSWQLKLTGQWQNMRPKRGRKQVLIFNSASECAQWQNMRPKRGRKRCSRKASRLAGFNNDKTCAPNGDGNGIEFAQRINEKNKMTKHAPQTGTETYLNRQLMTYRYLNDKTCAPNGDGNMFPSYSIFKVQYI